MLKRHTFVTFVFFALFVILVLGESVAGVAHGL